jgi:hypothetical protein
MATIFKKDGTLTQQHSTAIFSIIRDRKIYPARWVISGRRKNLVDKSNYYMDVANYFGFKVKTGNDAPRGGQEGEYIEFSAQAQKSLIQKFKSNNNA